MFLVLDYRFLDLEYRLLNIEFKILDLEYRFLDLLRIIKLAIKWLAATNTLAFLAMKTLALKGQ